MHRALARIWSAAPIVLAASLLACGGGAGDEPPSDPAACGAGLLAIDQPSNVGVWATDRATVELGGWAPTPGGPYGGNCPGDPQYTIGWRNETSGDAGDAAAWTGRYYGILGPYCSTRWGSSSVALVPGDNRIRVSGVGLGDDCIVIKRLPSP